MESFPHQLLVLSGLLLCLGTLAECSAGDRSYTYNKCIQVCNRRNCSQISDDEFLDSQPWYDRLLRWRCPDECSYSCMWTTVQNFQRDGTPIPQFHGKWPFIRFFGIQEPASVVFSLFNGLAHVWCLIRLWRNVPSHAPMYRVWNFYSIVGVNTWFWSTVFHSRDFPFTEQMDYFCAISLVLCSVFVLCCRVLGTEQWWKPGACLAGLLAFFIYHVHYLSMVKFDYGYNLKATITVGIINSFGWLLWSKLHYKEQPYVWKPVMVVISLYLLLLLEVFDFPPIWWVFDAHSLWHAGTAPLGFLWSSFVEDDAKFLFSKSKFKKAI